MEVVMGIAGGRLLEEYPLDCAGLQVLLLIMRHSSVYHLCLQMDTCTGWSSLLCSPKSQELL